MPEEGFFGGLNRHFLTAAAWIFTVGGGVAGLLVSGAYAWVAFLCMLVGIGSLTLFAYEQWRLRKQAEQQHASNVQLLENNERLAAEKAELAESKLNAIPADLLLQLEASIRRWSLQDLAAYIGDHIDYVSRMLNLASKATKPIALRSFAKRAGQLYAEAKLSAQAIGDLRDDDPFVLEFKNNAGLVTASAFLRVHQTEAGKEIVWFRVETHSGDEMQHVDALADMQQVPGKGYTVRPACDVKKYSSPDFAKIALMLRALIEEVLSLRG
ncbi:MAG TPA: hypothetical protein VE988_26280 [Gemmataceae bacterium]|nr:hypothetical protein [Gemmataceae bacterium]